MTEIVQLRSFLAVAEAGSFTRAAERLGLGQSTISQHVARLEAGLGRRLLRRDTRHVALTAEGEALIAPARSMLALDAQMRGMFREGALRGRLRLGVSEDFVSSRLAAVLEEFLRAHPSVDLELTVGLSAPLYEAQELGELDLVLAKRRAEGDRGTLVHREPLVWLAREPERVLREPVLPLIAFPAPSVTRRVAVEALASAGRDWRVVCTCASLAGLVAAARAGMGLLVQPRSMAPEGLTEIAPGRLPALEDVEFVIVARPGADRRLVAALSEAILARVFATGTRL